MAGVRIHHPTLTNAILAIEDPEVPYGRRPRPDCALCGHKHDAKTRHIRLDSDGNAIVSETVWDALQELMARGLTAHRFLVMNEVVAPPPITIDFTAAATQPVFEPDGDTLHQITEGR